MPCVIDQSCSWLGISPYQVILQVIQNSQRLEIPYHVPGPISDLMNMCWDELPENRPSFDECVAYLSKMQFEIPSTPYPLREGSVMEIESNRNLSIQ
jgi:hypothetical protein